MMAQAIRAILLASATAATFVGRRSINWPSHGRFCVPCLRAEWMTAIAPTTSNRRKYRLPCLVILPSLSLPPVVCCFGTNPIQAARLRPACRRVSALGRVHHRLHLLDHQDKVEFKKYLQQLCEDISGLLFEVQTGYAIEVDGPEIEIPTASAIPLGFIVNELITNSAKYAKSHITVRIETVSATNYSLSVLDDGPGLPADFDPASSTGLGMKIIQTLVKQIGGALQIVPVENGHGARFTVMFCSA